MSRAGMDLEFEDVFRRISEQTDLKTSTNLAEFLGYRVLQCRSKKRETRSQHRGRF
jgi:hypothetical protein